MQQLDIWYGSLIHMHTQPDVSVIQLQQELQQWHDLFGERFPTSMLDLLLHVESSPHEWIILHLFKDQPSYDAVRRDTAVRQWTQSLLALFASPPIITNVGVGWRKVTTLDDEH